MKAISIKQPWASLIAHGIKDIENRTWKCPKKYLGQRVLIHAAKTAKYFLTRINFTETMRIFRMVLSSAAWLYPIAYKTILQSGLRKVAGTGY